MEGPRRRPDPAGVAELVEAETVLDARRPRVVAPVVGEVDHADRWHDVVPSKGEGPDVGLCNIDLWQKYGALLLSQKRTEKLTLEGGWMGLALNVGSKSIPIIADDDCWDTYVQFPRFAGLTIASASDMWEWMAGYDGKGDVLRRSPDGRTDWEGTQKWYMNLVGLQGNDMARMSGKTT